MIDFDELIGMFAISPNELVTSLDRHGYESLIPPVPHTCIDFGN